VLDVGFLAASSEGESRVLAASIGVVDDTVGLVPDVAMARAWSASSVDGCVAVAPLDHLLCAGPPSAP